MGDRVSDSAGGGQVVRHRGTEVGELMAQLLGGTDPFHERRVLADRGGEDLALLGQVVKGALALLGGVAVTATSTP